MWVAPKTDWHSSVDSDGNYIGDRFNASDFNRIKNNLEFLRELAVTMYRTFDIHDIGIDKTPRDYVYADEINRLEENLNTINNRSVRASYGNTPTFRDNGLFIDYKELNRIERAIQDMYDKLLNQCDGRRMFTWNFGTKGGL